MTKLKWAIKRTPENYKEVNEWANKAHSEPFQFGNEYRSMMGYVHSDLQDHGSLSHEHKNNHYTEITLDEFRLLTDPGKWHDKTFEKISFIDGWIYTDLNGEKRTISDQVLNELQRMWKERESDEFRHERMKEQFQEKGRESKVLRVNETAYGVEEVDMSGILGFLPNPKFHVDDFKTEAEKETLKLLKKINRKLNRILKRQKEQF